MCVLSVVFHSSINDVAEDKLKVFGLSFDWSNKTAVNRLFAMFQGSFHQRQSRPQTAGSVQRVDLHRTPVSLRVKLKIVPHLLKSQLAANTFPHSLQVCIIVSEA